MIATREHELGPILGEDIMDPVEVQEEIAQLTGHRPHMSTIHRWFNDGAYGAKLECIRIGRQRVTSRQAVQRFLSAQQKR